jgi:hypothetical protein
MCFLLAVVRDALLFPRSYPPVIGAEGLLPLLLPAARTSDNRDVSDAARIRTATMARISLSMAGLFGCGERNQLNLVLAISRRTLISCWYPRP